AGDAGLAPDTPVTRETNTMPGWAGSCWYYLRYCDPKNHDRLVGERAEQYWMRDGVDLYVGGAEHAVLHLLYARFWHQVLHDLGEVSTPEPFTKLFHQGLITSHAYQRDNKSLVPIDEVDESTEGDFVERATGERVSQVIAKMSKSLKNVVNPDDVIADHGADVFRLYEMYMGPLEASKPWNTRDIVGLSRFLARAWRLCVDEHTGELLVAPTPSDIIERALHKTIAKVGPDIQRLSFNTAIAAMIEFVNLVSKEQSSNVGGLSRDQIHRFARTLAPFTPHVAEELWSKLDEAPPISLADWPNHDEAMLVEDAVEVAIQINGKVRHRLGMPADADKDRMQELALADPKIAELISGKAVRKVIAVPGRMVNIVAN
ncbi:MAG: class I tRNA ligase family protein, partial [Planctomycetota bacterium]